MANRSGRTLRVLAATGTVGALMLISASSAAAVDPGANSSAYGLSVTGLLTIAPTPQSTCPPGSTESVLAPSLGALGSIGLINASTTCTSATGTSTATAGAADVALLGTAAAPAISADLISAQCSATAPADPTGSTTVVNLRVAGVLVDVPVGSTTPITIDVPLVGTVIINEQTLSGGVLTVNALHITLLGGVTDIIIGHVSCGPNTAAPAIAAFSFQTLPLILGGLAILALLVYGLRTSLRRIRTTV